MLGGEKSAGGYRVSSQQPSGKCASASGADEEDSGYSWNIKAVVADVSLIIARAWLTESNNTVNRICMNCKVLFCDYELSRFSLYRSSGQRSSSFGMNDVEMDKS